MKASLHQCTGGLMLLSEPLGEFAEHERKGQIFRLG